MNTPRSHGYGVIPTRAFDDTRMTPNLITVLGVLGTYADRSGRCWPSQATLARRRGVTRQAVSKALQQLAAYGYIDMQRRQGSSMYRVLFDADLPTEFDRWRDEYDQGPSPVDELDQALERGADQQVQPEVAPHHHWAVDNLRMQREVESGATSEVAPDAMPEVAQNNPKNNQPPADPAARATWVVTSFLRGAKHPPAASRAQLEDVVRWALGGGWRADQILAALPLCQAFTRNGLDFNLRRAEQLRVAEPRVEIRPNPDGCDECSKGWVEQDGGGVARCQACATRRAAS